MHFGLFMFAHLQLLAFLTGEIASVHRAGALHELLGEGARGIALGLLGLAVSHGFSLVVHWFVRGERHDTPIMRLFVAPYPRILVMHATVMAGALLMVATGNVTWMLAALVVMKIAVDAWAHWREHRAARVASATRMA